MYSTGWRFVIKPWPSFPCSKAREKEPDPGTGDRLCWLPAFSSSPSRIPLTQPPSSGPTQERTVHETAMSMTTLRLIGPWWNDFRPIQPVISWRVQSGISEQRATLPASGEVCPWQVRLCLDFGLSLPPVKPALSNALPLPPQHSVATCW